MPNSDDIVYAAKLNGETKLYRENVFNSDKPVELPFEKGGISAIRPDKNNPDLLFISHSSTAEPTRIGKYDIKSKEFSLLFDSRPSSFTTRLSEAKFLQYPTFDDWKIPTFDIMPNASAPKLKGNPIVIIIHG